MTLEEYMLRKSGCKLFEYGDKVMLWTPIHRGWLATAGYGMTREAQLAAAVDNALNMVNTQIVTRR